MRKVVIIALSLVVVPSVGFSQTLARHANLEPTCSASGSGMDPRCVGDTFAGTESDALSTRQERTLHRENNLARAGTRY
jgi:hypothetical protein